MTLRGRYYVRPGHHLWSQETAIPYSSHTLRTLRLGHPLYQGQNNCNYTVPKVSFFGRCTVIRLQLEVLFLLAPKRLAVKIYTVDSPNNGHIGT